MSANLTVGLLGPLELRREGETVEVAAPKQRALLALLALDVGRVVSSDVLVDRLWAGHAPVSAVTALQVYVSQLRKLVGAPGIVTRRPGYLLAIPVDAVDAFHFEALVADGRGLLAAGDPESAAAVLGEALSLWRGDALAEFVYEDWAAAPARRLEELRLVALEDRLDAQLRLGGGAELTGELEALVGEYPLRERLRGQHMLALYRAGRQADALAAYQDARHALVEGLGIDLSPELSGLERAILNHDPAIDPPAPPVAASAADDAGQPPASDPVAVSVEMAVCPRCGHANPLASVMCSSCRSTLNDNRRRQRKTVTAVFADVVDSTMRAVELDVEDVADLLDRFVGTARQEFERYGATVEKSVGDAVAAVFGAPVTHEDDSERAVRSALAIRDAIEDINRQNPGLDLHVRVGVNTGEALVNLDADATKGEGIATGDVMNTAARLQTAAPIDGILVGETTYRATNRAILYDKAEPVAAKGKPEPIAVWIAQRARSRLGAEVERAPTMPLIGRERELDVLTDALERSRQEHSVQLVTLLGVPGIGKSRLVSELLRIIDAEPGLTTWRQGRSLPYGDGVAFWALGEMVKAQAGILESDSAQVAAERLRDAINAVIASERDREWVERHLRPLVGLEAEGAPAAESGRVEAFAAWRRFFEALAEDGSTVLVFEDIHWADEALLDFIDLVADRAGELPLLIVCTTRPELTEKRPMWGGGKTNALTISLSPLSGNDTARLVAELLDQALLPAEVQLTLLERAEGNPLYAQEYVRMLQDRGLLTMRASGWVLRGEVGELPESVQGIISARLDTLTPDEKRLIHDAAVVGRTAWLGAACAVGGHSPSEADELLHQLERKQLLRRHRRSSVEGEVEFSFSHGLTQEIAYAQIRRAERAQQHERAAGWIERLAGEREDKAELLAHHYAAALTVRRQLGDNSSDLEPRAREAFAEAARQAAAVNAHTVAARYSQAALDLTATDDPARARLLLDYATARYRSGTADEQILKAAARAQVAAEDWETAAQAEEMLGAWSEYYVGEGEVADAHFACAGEYATRIPPSETMCRVAYSQACRLLVAGRAEEALALTNDAIRTVEPAKLEAGRALLLVWHGSARVELGDAGGMSDMREAAETLARHAHPKTAVAYENLAETVQSLGDLRGAEEFYAMAAEWAERFAEPDVTVRIATGLAGGAYQAGRWDEALSLLASIDTPDRFADAQTGQVRSRISVARGTPRDAITHSQAVIDLATSSGNHEKLLIGLELQALALDADGHTTEAITMCERFLARWQEISGMTVNSIELCEIAPILAAHGCHAQLRDAALLLPEASRWRDPLLAVSDERYAHAAALYGEIGSRPLAMTAHLLAAQQAHAEGRSTAAAEHTDAALAFAIEVDASFYQHKANLLVTVPGQDTETLSG